MAYALTLLSAVTKVGSFKSTDNTVSRADVDSCHYVTVSVMACRGHSTTTWVESCRRREQNTAQSTGSALVRMPAGAGCYANSLLGLSLEEVTLERLTRPSELCDLKK